MLGAALVRAQRIKTSYQEMRHNETHKHDIWSHLVLSFLTAPEDITVLYSAVQLQFIVMTLGSKERVNCTEQSSRRK